MGCMFDNGLYVGRFQPFHKGHHNRIRITLDEGHVKNVVPVLFTYTNDGDENPTYHHFLTFEEREELFRCVGLRPKKFEVELSRGMFSNLNPNYVWTRRKELLGALDGDNVLITNSIGEVVAGTIMFQLPMRYIPKYKDEPDIRGEEIRKLLLQDRKEEAVSYLPSECRKTFVEIVRGKDMKKLYREKERDTKKIGPFKIKRNI